MVLLKYDFRLLIKKGIYYVKFQSIIFYYIKLFCYLHIIQLKYYVIKLHYKNQ